MIYTKYLLSTWHSIFFWTPRHILFLYDILVCSPWKKISILSNGVTLGYLKKSLHRLPEIPQTYWPHNIVNHGIDFSSLSSLDSCLQPYLVVIVCVGPFSLWTFSQLAIKSSVQFVLQVYVFLLQTHQGQLVF